MARLKSQRYTILKSDPLWENGHRLAYAFGHLEGDLDVRVLLVEVRIWLEWIDFAFDWMESYPEPEIWKCHPSGGPKAQNAWTKLAWSLMLVARQLVGLRDRTPEDSEAWEDVDDLLRVATILRLDIVDLTLGRLLVPLHEERLYPEDSEPETIH